MKVRPILTWAIFLFLAFLLATKAGAAISTWHHALSWFQEVGNSLNTFVQSL